MAYIVATMRRLLLAREPYWSGLVKRTFSKLRSSD